jgi:hypothetical protein
VVSGYWLLVSGLLDKNLFTIPYSLFPIPYSLFPINYYQLTNNIPKTTNLKYRFSAFFSELFTKLLGFGLFVIK